MDIEMDDTKAKSNTVHTYNNNKWLCDTYINFSG